MALLVLSPLSWRSCLHPSKGKVHPSFSSQNTLAQHKTPGNNLGTASSWRPPRRLRAPSPALSPVLMFLLVLLFSVSSPWSSQNWQELHCFLSFLLPWRMQARQPSSREPSAKVNSGAENPEPVVLHVASQSWCGNVLASTQPPNSRMMRQAPEKYSENAGHLSHCYTGCEPRPSPRESANYIDQSSGCNQWVVVMRQNRLPGNWGDVRREGNPSPWGVACFFCF